MDIDTSKVTNITPPPHNKDKIAVIIPCYNEEQTIEQVIDELNALSIELEIYVFDNNSKDRSAQIVKDKIQHTPNLHLYNVSTQGKGAVLREAFSIIDATYYVIIDADTQYDSTILPSALEYFKSHRLDMLNIARNTQGESIHRPGHSFGNYLFTKSASILFGRKIQDMLSGYRIFSRAFVKSFPSHSNGFEIETELTIFAAQQRLRFDEIDAPYKSRPEGSFSKLSTFKDGFKILGMLMYLLFSERPMMVFGILGFICLSLGLILGVPIVAEFIDTRQVPRFPTLFLIIGLGVSAVILFITGFISWLVVKSIKEARHFAYLNAR